MKLSICIPTYNRIKYLSDLLPIIISQCDEADQTNYQIEILVSDNHSTDETQSFMESVKNNRVKYYRNSENIGAERNYHSLIRKAIGEYVWMFGDDDLLEPHAVSDVLQALQNNNCSLFIAGGSQVAKPHGGIYNNYNTLIDTVVSDKNIAFLLCHAFITCNIFKRSIYDLDFAERQVKTQHSHPYAIAAGLKNTDEIYMFEKPIIKTRDERAPLHIAIPDIILKQSAYFLYVGNKFNNKAVKRYAATHLINSVVRSTRLRVKYTLMRITKSEMPH